jgi:hypothetical protein
MLDNITRGIGYLTSFDEAWIQVHVWQPYLRVLET